MPFLAQYRYKPSACDKRTPVGADLGPAAGRGRDRQAAGHRRPAEVHGRRLPEARPTGGTAASSTCPRSGSSPTPTQAPTATDSLLLGWAGWDHREQAAALITLIQERSDVDGWDTAKLRPCWPACRRSCPGSASGTARSNPDFGMSYADAYDGYLTAQRETRSLTEEDLRNWTPTPVRQGGRKRKE